jgi:hypothetical protein
VWGICVEHTHVAVQYNENLIHARAEASKQAARISSGDTDCKADLCSNSAYVGEGAEMYNIPGNRSGVWK